MNRCSIWYRLVFVLNLCLQAFKSYGLLFRGMHEERKMMVGDMQLQTALYKSLCAFYEAQTKNKRFTILQRIDLCTF